MRRFSTMAARRLSTARKPGLYQLSYIGAPFAGGQPKGGVDRAPQAFRQFGIIQKIEDLGWEVQDLGDLKIPEVASEQFEKIKNPHQVGRLCNDLHQKVFAEAARGAFPLVVGGDHSIAVGTIAGVQKHYKDLGVIWVDAHADINTPSTTPSGNLHGMPVSILLGLGRAVPGFDWLKAPPLRNDQIIYVGLRDLEHAEKQFLRELNIESYDMHDVDKLGIGAVMERILHRMGRRPMHLSFDIDGLDPKEAPSTGTPVRGGLTFREGAFICEYLHHSQKLVSMELVEVNPSIGTQEDAKLTMSTGISLLKAALGETLT